MPLTAYAYLRVSGDEQADRGLPIAGQRRAVEQYAAEHGLHLARVFVDEAKSGASDERAEFQRLMQEAHQDPPPCQVILFWSWSRFARSQDDATFWKASLRRHGVEIRDVSGETPQVDGFEYVIESMIHWRDEQRLQEISRDARRGQQALAQRGYVPSGARPPRGYKVQFEEVEIEGRKRQVRRWVPDPKMWPLVKRAWELRLQGRSYRDILRECPGLYSSVHSLTTFFGNPIYKGELWFGGTKIEVEPVVTSKEWAQVNRNRGKRRSGNAMLVGHRTPTSVRSDGYERSGWRGYRCPNKRAGECDLPYITAKTIEGAVIEKLLQEVLAPAYLEQCLDALAASQDAERPAMLARLRTLRKRCAEIT